MYEYKPAPRAFVKAAHLWVAIVADNDLELSVSQYRLATANLRH